MTIRQHDLRPPKGAHRRSKRYGRGDGSGRGSYSGRGMKGQQSRTGPGARSGFEGNQLPWIKAMPKKRGSPNPLAIKYAIVNLAGLQQRFEAGEQVTPERMASAGLIHGLKRPVKVLGDGEITKALTVTAHRFSASAREKVMQAGGSCQELAKPRREGKQKDAG